MKTNQHVVVMSLVNLRLPYNMSKLKGWGKALLRLDSLS